MARLLLLADSNFLNNYGAFKGPKIQGLEIKSCQNRVTVLNELAGIEEGIVVVSCLDMIASEVSKNNANELDRSVDIYLSQLLYKLVDKIDEANGKLAVGIIAPLFWSSHLAVARKDLNHFHKTLKMSPLDRIWVSDNLRNVKAGADGTHLTSNSARHYIQHILNHFKLIDDATRFGIVKMTIDNSVNQATASWADDQPEEADPDAVMQLVPPVDEPSPARTTLMITPVRSRSAISTSILSSSFSQQQHPAPPPGPSDLAERLMRLAQNHNPSFDTSVPPPRVGGPHQAPDPWRTADVNSSLARIERRLGSIEAKIFYDNVMMAGLKEEQDLEANKAMLNRIVFSGVALPSLQSVKDEEKIALIKGKIEEIIDFVKGEDKSYKVLFVKHLNPQVRGQQKAVIEVKLEDAKQAASLRTDFVKKQKEEDSVIDKKLHVAPVVRLATRVRVEILYAVVNLLYQQDRSIIRAMCLQFIPKPVIKIVRKSASGTEFVRTMTFIEAVCWVKENDLCGRINLVKAYERAGASFRGTLSQTFVLLSPSNSAGF